MNDMNAERKAAAERVLNSGVLTDYSVMAEGLGRIRSAGIAAGITEETITKSQENFLATQAKLHATGKPVEEDSLIVDAEKMDKPRRKFRRGYGSAAGTPAVYLPLPLALTALLDANELLESLADGAGLTGSAVLQKPDTGEGVLLRWVTK